jgi:MoxR-like ATPase
MTERLIIHPAQGQESVLPLNGDPLVIGSDPTCNIILGDPETLPQQVLVEKDSGGWVARCYDANTPLQLDGRTATELRLEHGAAFTVGSTRFSFFSARSSLENLQGADVEIEDPQAAAIELNKAQGKIVTEMARVVIGQSAVVKQILVALFARGHCLLVGTPGLAKTLMARSLAGTLELQCKRVQFTPDLMPADILGTEVLEEDSNSSRRQFRFKRGPVFTNLLLADEINRTPPKTQAALLEAMQERRVTVSGVSHDLPQPFFVIATQNPIEQEGTYPLPEAQLDRFMFSVKVGYPSAEEEERIITETTQDSAREVARVLDGSSLIAFQHLVRKTPVSPHVGAYVTRLVRSTRPDAEDALDFISRWVRWGAGPRAGQYLLLAAKANAILSGRLNVSCDDVREFALPVLRHRVLCNFAAASEGVDSDEIVRKLLEAIPEPDYDSAK